MAEIVAQTLASYAFGLVKHNPYKCLVVIEDDDGNRFWAGNGKLRAEFLHDRKLENRSWGMMELEDVIPAASTIIQPAPEILSSIEPAPEVLSSIQRDKSPPRNGAGGSSSRRDRSRSRSPRRNDSGSSSRRDRGRDREKERDHGKDRDRDHSPRRRRGNDVHDSQYDRSLRAQRDPAQDIDSDVVAVDPPPSALDDPIYSRFDSASGPYDAVPVADFCPRCGLIGHDIPTCPLVLSEMPPPLYGSGIAPGLNLGPGLVFGAGPVPHPPPGYMGGGNPLGDGLLPTPTLMPAVPSGMMNLPPTDIGNFPTPPISAGDPESKSKQRRDRRIRAERRSKGSNNAPRDPSDASQRRQSRPQGSIDTPRGSNDAPRGPNDAPRRRRSGSLDRHDELRPLLRELEDQGKLTYKWLSNAKKYLLIIPAGAGKSDTLVKVTTVKELSEASEKYGFIGKGNGRKKQAAADESTAAHESTAAPEETAPADPPSDLLSGTLGDLEARGTLRHKWLPNSKKFLIILPKPGKSDVLINVANMKDLLTAARVHGFSILGDD